MNFKYSLIAYGLIDSAQSPWRGCKKVIMAEKRTETPCASRDMLSHRKSSRNHYMAEKSHTYLPAVSCVSIFSLLPGFLLHITAEVGQRLDNWDYLHCKRNEDKALFKLHFCHRVLWVGEHKKITCI